MNHSFDIDHARVYGMAEAVLIQNFQFWIARNKANDKHLYEGRTWTYNSVKAFSELFPYLTINQVRRALERLVAAGVLVEGFYSPNATDRTKWYAFGDEAIWLASQSHLANLPNGGGAGAKPFGSRAKSLNKTDVNADEKPDGGRGSRLPEDWVLPKKWGDWALAEYPAWNGDHVRRVALMFKNHWTAKPGRDAVKLDWFKTWQNWCLKEPAVPHGMTPEAAAAAGGGEWWKSNSAIDKKGADLGLVPLDGEPWPLWRDRVFVAAGDGPWIEAHARANAPRVDGFKPAGKLKDVLKAAQSGGAA